MEASVVGLFRTLLIIVIVYYAIKFLMRFVFPILLRSAMKKHSKENVNSSPESTRKKKEKTDNLGEYIDFEEVKDKRSD